MGGLYPGFTAATPPLTGTETVNVDTGLSGGRSPQTENVTTGDISGLGAALQAWTKYPTVPIGSVAYGSFGTSTTPVAGTIYWASLFLPRKMTATGLGYLIGGTGGTDKVIGALYSSAGVLLANSAIAGTTVGTNDTLQDLAFTTAYAVTAPGLYYVAIQMNGTTARFRSVAASTFLNLLTASATGVFGTLTALTVPTTFTADKGPIAYIYE